MKRHLVSASGMVKVMRTTPLESEVSCGKKNAVSLRFLRAVTAPRLGLGPGGLASGERPVVSAANPPTDRVSARWFSFIAITAAPAGAGASRRASLSTAPELNLVTP